MENTIESFCLSSMDSARPVGKRIINAELCTASLGELFAAARRHARSVGSCHCVVFGKADDGSLTRFLCSVWTFESTGRESVQKPNDYH